MKPSADTMNTFYQQLGKLFYAIASIDKNIVPQEVEQLKKIVKAEWLPLENTTDAFGTDAAFQIEIVFDYLVKNDSENNNLIEKFAHFKKEHPSIFTESVNKLIMKTANAIASSFAGLNKSELVFLSQLQIILSK